MSPKSDETNDEEITPALNENIPDDSCPLESKEEKAIIDPLQVEEFGGKVKEEPLEVQLQEQYHQQRLPSTDIDKSLDLLGSFETTPLSGETITHANILDDIPATLTTIAKPDPIITHTKPEFDTNYSQDSLIFEQQQQYTDFNNQPNLTTDTSTTTSPIVESEIVETEMYQPKDNFEQVESSSAQHQVDNDLADFEIPQFSGSNSGSELKSQPSPPLKASTTTTSSTPRTLTTTAKSSTCSPNLSAVKKLLMANYSRISHILNWKDPIETGIIFGIGATVILALTFFSIISVFAYSGLGLILGSSSLRLYKVIMKMLNMPAETRFDNIWNKAIDINVSMSPKKVHDFVDNSLDNINDALSYVKRVLLVEDKVATITFGLFLYVLTYLGSWFNGMTLITLTYIGLFTLPVVYDKNKDKIDDYVSLASGHLCNTVNIVTNKVSTLTSSSSHKVTSSSSEKQD